MLRRSRTRSRTESDIVNDLHFSLSPTFRPPIRGCKRTQVAPERPCSGQLGMPQRNRLNSRSETMQVLAEALNRIDYNQVDVNVNIKV